MIDRIQFDTGTATGDDGAATSTGHSPHVSGLIQAVHLCYNDDPPAGTDFTLSDEGDPHDDLIVDLSGDSPVVDQKLYPRTVAVYADGTAFTYDGSSAYVQVPFAVHGRLEATIDEANAGDSVTVTVWIQT